MTIGSERPSVNVRETDNIRVLPFLASMHLLLRGQPLIRAGLWVCKVHNCHPPPGSSVTGAFRGPAAGEPMGRCGWNRSRLRVSTLVPKVHSCQPARPNCGRISILKLT